MNRIGVVTVTYNSGSVLADFLASVWKQTHEKFLLYIIDSGSTDGTADILANIGDPRVRIVKTGVNIGFAAGSNLGMRMALEESCDAVMLLNNDTIFGPELFQVLLDGMKTFGCDMTTPKMLYFDRPNQIWAAGGSLNAWLGYRNNHHGENEIDDGRFDRPGRVTFTPFCCVLMQKRVIEKIGYLDEQYFVYTEDADYCFRVLKSNLSLWYVPHAKLWHKVNSLTGHMSLFLIRYCTRNRILFLRKHLTSWRAFLWYAIYWIYQCGRYLSGKDERDIWELKRAAMREGLKFQNSSCPGADIISRG